MKKKRIETKEKKVQLKIEGIKYLDKGYSINDIAEILGQSREFFRRLLLGNKMRPCQYCGNIPTNSSTLKHEENCINKNKNCINCGASLSRSQFKFCSNSCSAKVTNLNKIKNPNGNNGQNKENILKSTCDCAWCGLNIKRKRGFGFCNRLCEIQYKENIKIDLWLKNPSIINPDSGIPRYIRRFLLAAQDCKCAICGLESKWNDKELIFICDHIDGNSENNFRDNLRLVCPNCDTQLPTFKSKNRGNGRHYRKVRRDEGKSF